jgi:RNA polymerase sigma factor (sigma-70 family)
VPAGGGSDGELLVRARTGDVVAWEALVDRFGGRLWAIARAYRIDPSDAADICQVTWLQLATNMDRIREPECVGIWLATTARNECFRLLRRQRREVPTDDDALATDDEVVPPAESRILAGERERAVWDAVETLPPNCRRLIRLMMADPPATYEEIMSALDMPKGSIGPTRRRCLEKLRRRLSNS